MHFENGNARLGLWIGLAAGAAVGIGVAVSRRRRTSPWEQARSVTRKVANRSGDLADAAGDIINRVRVIYEESRKVAEDAAELWSHGRKMVGV